MAKITTTERLPFPIAKPNADTFATKTSEIGHGDKSAEEVINNFGEKVKDTSEEGFYLCDSVGNVIMKFTATKGFDVAKISPRLKLSEMSQSDTDEGGYYLTDNEGNVALKYTDKGLDVAKISPRMKKEELSQSNTYEEGYYVTDNDGNIMFSLNADGVNFLASTALLNYLRSRIGGGGGSASYDIYGYPILDDSNPLAMLIKGRSRACHFKSWGVIGASYETDYMDVKLNGENTTMHDPGYDWPTLFGQMNSVTVGNFAMAGRPLRYWLNSPNGYGALVAADPMEAYIVNSSSNDYAPDRYDEPVGNIDTDIDYNNPDNNAQTWVGCLATIIQKLRIKSPRCYIFMATVRKYTTQADTVTRITPYIQAERDICNCFDHVYLIDMWVYGARWTETEFKEANLMGLHPTRNGHIYLADAFNTYIDWLVCKNSIGMRDAPFIGNNYQDRNNY